MISVLLISFLKLTFLPFVLLSFTLPMPLKLEGEILREYDDHQIWGSEEKWHVVLRSCLHVGHT